MTAFVLVALVAWQFAESHQNLSVILESFRAVAVWVALR